MLDTSPTADIVVVTWRGRATLPGSSGVCAVCPGQGRRPDRRRQRLRATGRGNGWRSEHLTSPSSVATAISGSPAAPTSGSGPRRYALRRPGQRRRRGRPGWLAALVAVLEAPGNERVAAVTVTSPLAGSERGQLDRQHDDPDRSRPGPGLAGIGAARSVAPDEVFGFCGAAALLRRAALDEVGLFEEDLFLYYEDTDLSWRLRAAGWTVRYEPGAVATHQHASSSHVGSPAVHPVERAQQPHRLHPSRSSAPGGRRPPASRGRPARAFAAGSWRRRDTGPLAGHGPASPAPPSHLCGSAGGSGGRQSSRAPRSHGSSPGPRCGPSETRAVARQRSGGPDEPRGAGRAPHRPRPGGAAASPDLRAALLG